MEHYLHRGQALAAFNHLLSVRALSLKSANARQELSAQPNNIHLDVQKILTALSQTEVSVVQSVCPAYRLNDLIPLFPLVLVHLRVNYRFSPKCLICISICPYSFNTELAWYSAVWFLKKS